MVRKRGNALCSGGVMPSATRKEYEQDYSGGGQRGGPFIGERCGLGGGRREEWALAAWAFLGGGGGRGVVKPQLWVRSQKRSIGREKGPL